ncbi:MAG: ubiE 1, partial [Gammaproteobacteria bacterium]|nr:ubiE 1 [Gammaproteobacteria bacterium]
ALRPGGQFIVVDYDKIPGKSSEFILQHVRDTKEVFTREIEAAGFSLQEDITIPGFKETFMRRFVKH